MNKKSNNVLSVGDTLELLKTMTPQPSQVTVMITPNVWYRDTPQKLIRQLPIGIMTQELRMLRGVFNIWYITSTKSSPCAELTILQRTGAL